MLEVQLIVRKARNDLATICSLKDRNVNDHLRISRTEHEIAFYILCLSTVKMMDCTTYGDERF